MTDKTPTTAEPGSWADDNPDNENGAFIVNDAQGNKIVTEIQERNGKQVRIVKKIRTVTRQRKINVLAQERINTWKKFGRAVQYDPIVTVIAEEVRLLLGKGSTTKDTDRIIDKTIQSLMTGSDQRWVARNKTNAEEEKPDDSDSKQGVYVAPGKKNAPPGSRGYGRDGDGNTVRVSNLSENVNEDHLKQLFGRIGEVTRVFLVRDKVTKESKGFAFINFRNKDEAQKAIDKLTGFGYEHLILHVEWAKPPPR